MRVVQYTYLSFLYSLKLVMILHCNKKNPVDCAIVVDWIYGSRPRFFSRVQLLFLVIKQNTIAKLFCQHYVYQFYSKVTRSKPACISLNQSTTTNFELPLYRVLSVTSLASDWLVYDMRFDGHIVKGRSFTGVSNR